MLKIYYFNFNKKECLERVVYELECVGIFYVGDKYYEYFFNFSGG